MEQKNFYERSLFLLNAPETFFTKLPLEIRN